MSTIPPPPHLEPSQLGTKEYWTSTYTTDLAHNDTNPTHTGTSWFSDSGAQEKIVRFLSSASSPSSASGFTLGLDKNTTTFLDLGTGNGSLLFALREAGWGGEMVGVDYSGEAVELARRVGEKRGAGRLGGDGDVDEEQGGDSNDDNDDDDDNNVHERKRSLKSVRFEVWDLMKDPPPPPPLSPLHRDNAHEGHESSWFPHDGFDVVLDKGTFDAISLSGEVDASGRRVCEGYQDKVQGLVKVGGFLLVTSCNWTEEELKGWFVGREDDGNEDGDGNGGRRIKGRGGLEVVGRIEYPVFRFGGRTGQSISSICFRRRE